MKPDAEAPVVRRKKSSFHSSSSIDHQCGAGNHAPLMAFDDTPVHSACKAEIVSIDYQSFHVIVHYRSGSCLVWNFAANRIIDAS